MSGLACVWRSVWGSPSGCLGLFSSDKSEWKCCLTGKAVAHPGAGRAAGGPEETLRGPQKPGDSEELRDASPPERKGPVFGALLPARCCEVHRRSHLVAWTPEVPRVSQYHLLLRVFCGVREGTGELLCRSPGFRRQGRAQRRAMLRPSAKECVQQLTVQPTPTAPPWGRACPARGQKRQEPPPDLPPCTQPLSTSSCHFPGSGVPRCWLRGAEMTSPRLSSLLVKTGAQKPATRLGVAPVTPSVLCVFCIWWWSSQGTIPECRAPDSRRLSVSLTRVSLPPKAAASAYRALSTVEVWMK